MQGPFPSRWSRPSQSSLVSLLSLVFRPSVSVRYGQSPCRPSPHLSLVTCHSAAAPPPRPPPAFPHGVSFQEFTPFLALFPLRFRPTASSLAPVHCWAVPNLSPFRHILTTVLPGDLSPCFLLQRRAFAQYMKRIYPLRMLLSSRNGMIPTYSMPLSSAHGFSNRLPVTTIFRKKSPVLRKGRVSALRLSASEIAHADWT